MADVQVSKYARKAGQSASRELSGTESAVTSMRRALARAVEYRDEIVRLRELVERQRAWLDSPDVPDDSVWLQRKDIYDDRWQTLEQTIGNLTRWVAIHLAEAGRYNGEQRNACETWVRQLYWIEEWIRVEGLQECRQYSNSEEPPF